MERVRLNGTGVYETAVTPQRLAYLERIRNLADIYVEDSDDRTFENLLTAVLEYREAYVENQDNE